MLANAIMYNDEDSDIKLMALDFKEAVEEELQTIFYNDTVIRRKSVSNPTEFDL